MSSILTDFILSFLRVRVDDIINVFFYGLTCVYVVALPIELLRQVIKYSSVGSAVAFLGQITLFEGRRPSEKRAKFCIERYSPVILRVLVYGEVDKIKLGKMWVTML